MGTQYRVAGSGMRTFGLITMAVLWVTAVFSTARAEDKEALEERLNEVGSELQELRRGEGAPAIYDTYRELKEERSQLHEKYQKEKRQLKEKGRKLTQKKELKEWLDKIDEKREKRNRIREKLQENIHKRGRKLYERRQEELADLAVTQTPNAHELGFTVLDYPKVDGSSSTQPLGMIVACKMLDCPYRWAGTERYHGRWLSDEKTISRREYRPFQPVPARARPPRRGRQLSLIGYRPIAEPKDPESHEDVRRSVIINRMLNVHAGTHGAYENVIKGNSDIGLVARTPSEDELELAEKKQVELTVKPIALDAFVFIKNYENPVENLSIEEIQNIYRGELQNWKKVGGPDLEITPYRRNRNSGSHELMKDLVMQNISFEDIEESRLRDFIHHGMGGPYIALTRDKSGLAYSVYYYEHFMAGSPDTELMAINGVSPSYESIQFGEYPYVTKVYAVVRKAAAQSDADAARLREWLLSDEGQKVVRESGYVPLRGEKVETQQQRQQMAPN